MNLPADLTRQLLERGTVGPAAQIPGVTTDDPAAGVTGTAGHAEEGAGKPAEKKQSPTVRDFLMRCHAHGLPTPQVEYPFAKGISRKWRFDFLFNGWLAVEVQGGIYGRGQPCPTCGRKPVGAHTSIAYMQKEMERNRWAVILGYSVFPCRPEEIQSGEIFPLIRKALETRL